MRIAWKLARQAFDYMLLRFTSDTTASPPLQAVDDRRGINPRLSKFLRALATILIVIVGVLIFTLTTSRTDYISYWSAGKLLMHRADPYSPIGAFALERSEGFSAGFMVMLNPPWALFLAAPLGFGGIRVGLFIWTLASVASAFVSVQLLQLPGKERAFASVFAPLMAAIFMGQSSPFLLLGFCLFLHFHRSHPFLAGASLLLMAIKPHLFLVFWAVLLADCLYRRVFLVLAGGASAVVASSLFAMCFDPHIWSDYTNMLRGSTLGHQSFPTLSMLFRTLIKGHSFWLLFVPSALAILWAIYYYVHLRKVWDWRIHGMLLMLVTVLVSPYSWLTDECVLLPSILFALTLRKTKSNRAWILLAINSVILYIALVRQDNLTSHAYLWTPLTWLAWFLYATHGFSRVGQVNSIQNTNQTAIETQPA